MRNVKNYLLVHFSSVFLVRCVLWLDVYSPVFLVRFFLLRGVLGDILARIPFETGFDCVSQGREARAASAEGLCKETWSSPASCSANGPGF